MRNLGKIVSRFGHFEFEDVIREVDDVDLIAPTPNKMFALRRKISNQLTQRASITFLNPGVQKVQLTKDYDVFFAIFEFVRDLLSLSSIKGWKERCKTSICWVDDIWLAEMNIVKGHLKILSQFDYVLLNCSNSIPTVQEMIQKPCHYIAPGIDTTYFCPYPNPLPRCVDVYSMGRRSPVTHQALLDLANQGKLFYIYDTIERLESRSPKEHRSLVANIAKRSRYFVANTAKVNEPSQTKGQQEVGFRFFEGAAAGAVMIGVPPKNEMFKQYFDWPDAVIDVPYDAHNIGEILSDLDAQPKRLEEIRKNGIVQTLQRHDWCYRWRYILDIVGLNPMPALLAREKQLKELAESAMKSEITA